MGDEGWRDSDVILAASLLATTCFAGASWLTAVAAVVLFAADMRPAPEWSGDVEVRHLTAEAEEIVRLRTGTAADAIQIRQSFGSSSTNLADTE